MNFEEADDWIRQRVAELIASDNPSDRFNAFEIAYAELVAQEAERLRERMDREILDRFR